MTKRQVGLRLSELTHRQIDDIAERERMTKGEVVALAVERLWQEMSKDSQFDSAADMAAQLGDEPEKG